MKKLIPVIITIVAVILILACVMITKEVSTSSKEKNEFAQLAEQVNTPNSEDDIKVYTRDLQPLFDANSDCIGWICIPDTELDYPVMYTPDYPQKYLRMNFEEEESSAGVPFLQESDTVESDHLIIYGHNMKNGSMFATVKKYADEDFFEEHPVIEFETGDGLTEYEVFAVVQLKSNDAWYGFVDAEDVAEYENQIMDISARSLYKTTELPSYGQQILTLSTCYGSDDDDRIIVVAAEQK